MTFKNIYFATVCFILKQCGKNVIRLSDSKLALCAVCINFLALNFPEEFNKPQHGLAKPTERKMSSIFNTFYFISITVETLVYFKKCRENQWQES